MCSVLTFQHNNSETFFRTQYGSCCIIAGKCFQILGRLLLTYFTNDVNICDCLCVILAGLCLFGPTHHCCWPKLIGQQKMEEAMSITILLVTGVVMDKTTTSNVWGSNGRHLALKKYTRTPTHIPTYTHTRTPTHTKAHLGIYQLPTNLAYPRD